MLRRSGRAVEAQKKEQLMGNSKSVASVSEAARGQRARSAPFFSFSGLLVSTTSKVSPESDTTRSPTSPLDFRRLASLGSCFFRSPRSPDRSWSCSRVGLGLLDSLGDDDSPRLSENKNVLFGSQKRVLTITIAQNRVSPAEGPSFYATAASKMGLADPDSSAGPPPGLLGSFPAGEIELSEDYTCVISHGPNPKTTHIFGNCSIVVEPRAVEGNEFLSSCAFCKTKLEDNRDVYIYGGERAFCSWECREQVMKKETESEMDKPANGGAESPAAAFAHEDP